MEVERLGNIYGFDGGNFAGNVYNKDALAPTILNMQGGGRQPMIFDKALIKQATKDGYIECKVGGDVCPTLTATETGVCKIESQYRIRKLTPLECWRLMDFTDEDFEKAAQVNSNTQLYKQAGNSIVRNVLVAILGQMIPSKEDVYKKLETR